MGFIWLAMTLRICVGCAPDVGTRGPVLTPDELRVQIIGFIHAHAYFLLFPFAKLQKHTIYSAYNENKGWNVLSSAKAFCPVQ